MRRPLDFDVRSYFHPLHPVLELLPVEVDVAQVEDAAQDLEDGLALLQGETEDLQWLLCQIHLMCALIQFYKCVPISYYLRLTNWSIISSTIS